jgi:hypothetical protein
VAYDSFSSVAVYERQPHQKTKNKHSANTKGKRPKRFKNMFFDGNDFCPDSLLETDKKLPNN